MNALALLAGLLAIWAAVIGVAYVLIYLAVMW